MLPPVMDWNRVHRSRREKRTGLVPLARIMTHLGDQQETSFCRDRNVDQASVGPAGVIEGRNSFQAITASWVQRLVRD